MPQVNKVIMPLLLTALVILFMGGCADQNATPVFDSETGTHPEGWVPEGHVSAAKKYPDTCQECHGTDLTGGIARVSCLSCHVNGSPFEATDCTSCHNTPPNGNTSPNRAGAHSVHNALQNVTAVCNTCHDGAGTGTESHFNGVDDVNILSTYSARSGAAGLNGDGTCSNISCHGGLATPVWETGTIDVNTDCVSCHSFGTAEYNGYHSGQHSFHVLSQGIACTSCHDTSQLSQTHFTTLNTQTLEGSAAATLNSSLNYSNGGCDPSCHGPETW